MIYCNSCGTEMSPNAKACPKCGHPNKAANRSVGFLLGLGILVFPLIFSWFTLRQGHSTLSRVVAGSWMGFNLFLNISLLSAGI